MSGLTMYPTLRFEQAQAEREARGLQTLTKQLPSDYCRLELAVDALKDSTDALMAHEHVWPVRGSVESLDGRSVHGQSEWTASVRGMDGNLRSITSQRVLLVCGAEPREFDETTHQKPGASIVGLSDVLHRDRLQRMSASLGSPRRWGVVGGSHSGMLAVMNICNMLAERPSEQNLVVNVFKQGLVFAEKRVGFTKHDGIGLKGPVADWCHHNFGQRRNKAGSTFVSTSTAGELVEVVRSHALGTREALWEHMEHYGVEVLVNATGFDVARRLPIIHYNGKRCDPSAMYQELSSRNHMYVASCLGMPSTFQY